MITQIEITRQTRNVTIIQIKLRFRKSPPYREIIVILIAYAQITFGARWKYERKMNGVFVEKGRK